jgi:hypothetical protein
MDKPPVLDRKQLAYFFKRGNIRGFGFLTAMRMLNPKTVSVIIDSDSDEKDSKEIENLKAVFEAMALDVKINVRRRHDVENVNFTDKYQTAMVGMFYEADLIIDFDRVFEGRIKPIIKPVQFHNHEFKIPNVITESGWEVKENIKEFANIPLEELFPIADIFLMDDIIKTRPVGNKRILITCFNDRDTKRSTEQLSKLLEAFPKFNKYLQIDIRFIYEEYQKEQHWQKTITDLDTKPYDHILAISKEIEVYTQDKDGMVSEKLGWLLI